MSILHTVNKTPHERPSLETCLEHAGPGSGVILIEDGVYGALRGGRGEPLIESARGRVTVYALEPDLRARGLPPARLAAGVEVVDYPGFVALCVRHDKVLSWL